LLLFVICVNYFLSFLFHSIIGYFVRPIYFTLFYISIFFYLYGGRVKSLCLFVRRPRRYLVQYYCTIGLAALIIRLFSHFLLLSFFFITHFFFLFFCNRGLNPMFTGKRVILFASIICNPVEKELMTKNC